MECDLQFADDNGDNAGLLVRVQKPHTGADAFIGYEISLSAKRGTVLLGRHRNDWKLLKEVARKPCQVGPLASSARRMFRARMLPFFLTRRQKTLSLGIRGR